MLMGLRKTVNLRSILHGFRLPTENKGHWAVRKYLTLGKNIHCHRIEGVKILR